MVSAEGRAASVSLKQSSGFAPLDAAAENAVRRWRFIPAKRGETPVAASVVVPVEFRLTS
jgi:protein TonB